jgi:metallo-beta-lactamase class B
VGVAALSARQIDTSTWNLPHEPFRIAGPIHYVGTAELAAYLIQTPQGHVLIDGGLPESAPLIEQSIRRLGLKVEDVEILLTTQAHFDHVGSLAALKRASGGTVMVMAGDAALVEAGGKGDFLFGDTLPFPAVTVDRVLQDGDTVSLGGISLKARLTPGHTKGCTTWTTEIVEGGRRLSVVFAGSTSVNPGTVLPSMPSYPSVGADYARAFAVQASLRPDIWLAAHAGQFGLVEKRAKQRAGGANPFIDPAGWAASVESRRAAHAKLPGASR